MWLYRGIGCHDLRAGASRHVIKSFAIFEVWTKLTWLPHRQGLRFARCMQRFELRQSHLRSPFFGYAANQRVRKNSFTSLRKASVVVSD